MLFDLDDKPPVSSAVWVYDAETRHKTPEEAYRIVANAVSWAWKNGATHIYKKTDSALRGNVGAELQALLDASVEDNLIFAPAYPQTGRTTRGGIQYINRVPVAESEFGMDPFEPVRHSSVADIIHDTSSVPVVSSACGLDGDALSRGSIIAADAEKEEDLDLIAEYCGEKDLRIFAGCAGFARSLAKAFKVEGSVFAQPDVKLPVMVICGSRNPVSAGQMKAAESAGFARVGFDEESLLDNTYYHSARMAEDTSRWAEMFRESEMLILDVNSVKTKDGCSDRNVVARNLAGAARELIDNIEIGTLFCTGGDSLVALIQELQVSSMDLVKELQPGVVLSRFVYRDRSYDIISKAGGFGESDLLLKIMGTVITINRGAEESVIA